MLCLPKHKKNASKNIQLWKLSKNISLKRGQEIRTRQRHFRVKSDQILQQHFAANQYFPSPSLQVCLLMPVGRSPTYRSLTFAASTHSLAMWAGAALHKKTLQGQFEKHRQATKRQKKGKTFWLCTNYCYNLVSPKQRQATPAITLRSPPGRHHFCAASPPRAFFL